MLQPIVGMGPEKKVDFPDGLGKLSSWEKLAV